MSAEEKGRLKTKKYQQVGLYTLWGMAMAASPFLFKELDHQTMITSASIIAAILTGLMVWLWKRMSHLFNIAEKEIIKGFITAKTADRGSKTTYYYFTIGTEDVHVDTDVFGEYRLGDAVEFEMFTSWGIEVLAHRKVEGRIE